VTPLPPGRVALVGAGGGLLLALGLPPLALPPLAVAGVLAFVLVLDRAETLQAGVAGGAAFAGAASFVGLHWVPAAAEPYLGVGGGLAAGLSVWSLHAAVGGGVAALAFPLRASLPLPVRAGAAWGVLEWLPGALPVVGIPWFGVAATLTAWDPLMALAGVAGSAGVGILVAAGAGVIAERVRHLPPRAGPPDRPRHTGPPPSPRVLAGVGLASLAVVAAALLAPEPGGPDPSPLPDFAVSAAPRPQVGILAWDRTREETADPERLRAGVRELLAEPLPVPAPPADPVEGEEATGRVVALLWPEAPVPALAPDDTLALRYLQHVQAAGAAAGGGSVTGAHALVEGRRYNTLIRTGEPGEPVEGVHRKVHLVAGVERTVLTGAGREGRGLAPGAGALPFVWAGLRAGGIICFEVLYPAEIARLRRRGAEVLVQGTNDAMLRPGGPLPVVADAARRQHLAVLRLRAAEFRIPVFRSALGGEALAVGPDGRVFGAEERIPLSRGAWALHAVPPVPPVPPSAWIGPPLGVLALAVLVLPLFALWRREQVLGRRRLGAYR
jgi:apolipoprotein N-acyltransferase